LCFVGVATVFVGVAIGYFTHIYNKVGSGQEWELVRFVNSFQGVAFTVLFSVICAIFHLI